MKLREWRQKQKWSYATMAVKLGELLEDTPSPTSIQSWENGSEPRVSAALAIEKLTNGAIKAKSWGK